MIIIKNRIQEKRLEVLLQAEMSSPTFPENILAKTYCGVLSPVSSRILNLFSRDITVHPRQILFVFRVIWAAVKFFHFSGPIENFLINLFQSSISS